MNHEAQPDAVVGRRDEQGQQSGLRQFGEVND
jgi:hypothetical protein